MAKKKAARKKAGRQKARPKAARPKVKANGGKASRAARPAFDALLAPVKGATRRNVGHVQLEVGRAGAARVKRMIYPPGFHWAVDMKPAVGTELCMHAHVGFLARGEPGGPGPRQRPNQPSHRRSNETICTSRHSNAFAYVLAC